MTKPKRDAEDFDAFDCSTAIPSSFRMSAHDAIERWLECFINSNVAQNFDYWWYWQECGKRDDGTYVLDHNSDWISYEDWAKLRGINNELVSNANKIITSRWHRP